MIARRLARFTAWVVLLGSPALSSAAWAQGFALDRFEPAQWGSEWFVLDSLDLRGELRPAAGIVLDWNHKPLVIYEDNGDERAALVEDQLVLHLGGSLVVSERWRFGINLPIAVLQSGVGGSANGQSFSAADGARVGDLRLSADVRLLGIYGDAITVVAGLQLHLPTGSVAGYTSDGSVRFVPQVLVAGELDQFVYGGSLGVNIRTGGASYADTPIGTELIFRIGGGLRALDRRLIIGPEIYGSTVLEGSGAFFGRRSTPFEGVLGAHYRMLDDWLVGAGGGVGLSRGFGSPQLRILASIAWVPALEEAEEPMVAAVEPAPAPPPPPPPPPPQAPPDTDGDGIFDSDDACPNDSGEASEDPKLNGCPPDRDHDGVADRADACPDQPGLKDQDPHKNGCLIAKIVQQQIRIVQQVKFKLNSAEILPESAAILAAVAEILTEHSELAVKVEGHTDSTGPAAINQQLSEKRARSVTVWLAKKHNIANKRLSSAGYGPTKPIDSNETEEGRQNNRRVEFHILEEGGQ